MFEREDLRRWSRPEAVLTADERDRLGEWLELFAQQLRVILDRREGGSGPPTVVELFAARRCAETVWDFDRVTSSRPVAESRRTKPMADQREDVFEEIDVRHRRNNLALEEIESARTLARVAGGAVEFNVVPFKAPRRKAG